MKPKNSAEAGDFDYSDVASEYDKHRKDFPKRFFEGWKNCFDFEQGFFVSGMIFLQNPLDPSFH